MAVVCVMCATVVSGCWLPTVQYEYRTGYKVLILYSYEYGTLIGQLESLARHLVLYEYGTRTKRGTRIRTTFVLVCGPGRATVSVCDCQFVSKEEQEKNAIGNK